MYGIVLNGCKEEEIIVKTKSNQTNRMPQVTDSKTHTPLLRRGLFLLYFRVFCIALALHRATAMIHAEMSGTYYVATARKHSRKHDLSSIDLFDIAGWHIA